jgi:hypothetical protein
MTPRESLLDGARIIGEVLLPAGFSFQLEAEGHGSGGAFASGRFARGERAIELHFRHSLGLVTYHLGELSLDHATFMRHLGVYGRNSYPGFTEDPLEGFRQLASDLVRYCQDFVIGDASQFLEFAQEHARNPHRFSGVGAT